MDMMTVTKFIYYASARGGFQLHSVQYLQEPVEWNTSSIQKFSNLTCTIQQVQKFNEAQVALYNTRRLRMEFKDEEEEEEVLATDINMENHVAFSIMTLLHHYVQTNTGFCHVGISPLQADIILMPTWMSSPVLSSEWQQLLKLKYAGPALDKSVLTVLFLGQRVRIQNVCNLHNMQHIDLNLRSEPLTS